MKKYFAGFLQRDEGVVVIDDREAGHIMLTLSCPGRGSLCF